jgi:hypothetical protein
VQDAAQAAAAPAKAKRRAPSGEQSDDDDHEEDAQEGDEKDEQDDEGEDEDVGRAAHQCAKCLVSFPTPTQMAEHTCPTDAARCVYCDRQFLRPKDVANHLRYCAKAAAAKCV